MKMNAQLILAALIAGICLSGCNKQSEEAESAANTQATAPAAGNETAANASGTTTYFGTEEEQTQPAQN
jgi:hypothetical protein